MELILKDGTRKLTCGYCGHISERGLFARPRNRKDKHWVCGACHEDVLAAILLCHQRQVERGVPADLQFYPMPLDFLRFMSDQFMEELRIKGESPNPVALPVSLKRRKRITTLADMAEAACG